MQRKYDGKKAVELLRSRVCDNIKLTDIAADMHISVSSLSRIFKNQTGYSPMNYMTQLKMQKACHLLDFTDMKIKQIANEVGIYDPYHFSKLFKHTIGISPVHYRRNKKG